MKVLKKMNQKGFLLVETLIVSLFVMSIFALFYANLFPLLGEYERVQYYNGVEATYVAHWARKIVLKGLEDTYFQTANTNGFVEITNCNDFQKNGDDALLWCDAFEEANHIEHIYLTPYQTQKFKDSIKDDTNYSRSLKEYIQYLPTYSMNTSKTAANGYYRVIVEFEKNGSNYYGTIEVKR